MRILKSISSALLAIVFSISIAYNADAATVYLKTALTGGTSTCLDYVDGDSLAGNDAAFVLVGDYFYVYLLSASSGAIESSPGVISPDSNAGTKRWILKGKIGYSGGESLIGENLNVTGTIDATGITDTYMPYMQAAGAGFGDSPLSTDGTDVTNSGSLTVQGGTVTVGVSATTSGNLVLNHAGTITFYDSGNDTSFTIGPVGNGTTTIGMTGSIDLSGSLDAGTLTIGSGSITDSSGSINFGNENLSTTGTLGSGDFTISDATPSIVLNDSADTDWWISGLSDLEVGTGSTPGSSSKFEFQTDGDFKVSTAGHGIEYSDGTVQTTATTGTTGSGVTSTTDINIASDTDANGSGATTISTSGTARITVAPTTGKVSITNTLETSAITAPTIYGSAASGGDITIEGSSHATNGDVLLQPVDGKVGIGTTTPNNLIQVNELISFKNADFETQIGYQAGKYDLGQYNTWIGYQAGSADNATGKTDAADANTAVGVQALYANTTGSYNSAQGVHALYSNTTGSNNSAQGYAALYANTTGYSNSAQGAYALFSNTTGNKNSAQGVDAGRFIADGTTGRTTGDNGLYLGAGTRASADGMDNEIVIGYNAIGQGSNTAVYGNTSMTKHIFSNGNVGIGTAAPTTTLAVAGGQSVKKTNVADAAYGTSALTSDYIISFTSLTAARTATISTEDVQSGTATQPRVMIFKDESGSAGTFPLSIVLENAGTIDGQAAYSINRAYGSVAIYLNGTSGFVAY